MNIMEIGDIQTKRIVKTVSPSGSYICIFERDWCSYLGVSEDDQQNKHELTLVIKAEFSVSHNARYLGIGLPFPSRV